MTYKKSWYQSKGIIGGLVAIGSAIFAIAGVDFNSTDQAELTDLIIAGVGSIGGIIAVYGRASANSKIK